MRDVSEQKPIILFDLGGVLVHSNGCRELHRLLPQVMSEEEILCRWNQSAAVRQFECGFSTETEFAAAFLAEWNLTMESSAFLQFFAEWVPGCFEGALSLVKVLREHYRVGCLSNANAIHWRRVAPLLPFFDFACASHLTGWMKPAPQAYEHVLQTTGALSHEILFFDDAPLNVSAAQAMGIHAYVARGPIEVNNILVSLGFLPPTLRTFAASL